VDDWAIASGSTAIISVTNKAAPPLALSIKKLRHSSVILLALAKLVTVAQRQILFRKVRPAISILENNFG
jgi:hypothetical protein